jgi:predicted PurR-regulated permease PerM
VSRFRIGLENLRAWAVAAGLLHIAPYLGPAVAAAATEMASFMQFESLTMVLMVGGIGFAIAPVVGTFVATRMAGRITNMYSAAGIISLLFWGRLWGVRGMLLRVLHHCCDQSSVATRGAAASSC